MKKHVKHESLLNTLARSVGHAAGTIAKATHEFADDAAAMVKTVKAETVDAETTKAKAKIKNKTAKTAAIKTGTAGRRKPRRATARGSHAARGVAPPNKTQKLRNRSRDDRGRELEPTA